MLLTKNIFLDTSVMIAHHFKYDSVQLRRLRELAQSNDAHLVTTSIVIDEMEANIRKRVDKLGEDLKRLRKDHPIAKNITAPALWSTTEIFNPAVACEQLIAQFNDYLEKSNTELVSLDGASAQEVFDWYFKKVAPFGGGEKKHEFPDAFTVSALEHWCATRDERLYVISEDGDLADYCKRSKRLIRLSRPAEFIDTYMRQTTALKFINEPSAEQMDHLLVAVSEAFGQLGFFIDDEEGEVLEVSVGDVEIEELSLLEVKPHEARVEAFVQLQFVAQVEYDDMETSIWDSEDKVSIPQRSIKSELARTFEANVVLTIKTEGDGGFASVKNVQFPTSNIPVSVDRYEE
ncbi:PIN domain-containing protein [Steroidobacter cummioxidans]|uniref:PIN domain-containing protein n=1 Tax=Steroidobacter cummioxidans TaxID=1803913 RepID=UPI0012900D21|nr:PIN domain-containing protein [Steroidobacter cummioxidans]